MIERDPYFLRTEVSNSDLSWLEMLLHPPEWVFDATEAYRFGTLLDLMITEKHKVNYFKLTAGGVQYTKAEFELAEAMAKEFWKDPFCAMLATNSEMQSICTKESFEIEYDGVLFIIAARLKYDLDARRLLKMTGDIKSTTAKTLKEFIAACHYFEYFRQRAWYMDIGDVDKDMIIGISKVNKQVFKVPVVRGEEFYNIGKRRYQELAWQWQYLFGDPDRARRKVQSMVINYNEIDY